MDNTNFQTIHQMGNAINNVVRQAMGRDNVQNIDMDYVTVAQRKRLVEETATGNPATFETNVIAPMELLIPFTPVQSGSGDPSPENIRPISGWTGVNVTVSPTLNEEDGTTYSIVFPSSAGTVYGGTLDVTTGDLVVDKGRIVLDGTQLIGVPNWRPTEGTSAWLYTPSVTRNRINTVGKIGAISDSLDEIYYGYGDAPSGEGYIYGGKVGFSSVGTNSYGLAVRVPVSGLTNNSLINAYLAENPITIVYPLATTTTYQLTPQEVRTLLGQNNIWADTGNVTVRYKNYEEVV